MNEEEFYLSIDQYKKVRNDAANSLKQKLETQLFIFIINHYTNSLKNSLRKFGVNQIHPYSMQTDFEFGDLLTVIIEDQLFSKPGLANYDISKKNFGSFFFTICKNYILQLSQQNKRHELFDPKTPPDALLKASDITEGGCDQGISNKYPLMFNDESDFEYRTNVYACQRFLSSVNPISESIQTDTSNLLNWRKASLAT